ncbi:MAG: nucleotidyltransferase family protein [Cyanobacteria bacterium P01_G01_bin.67]
MISTISQSKPNPTSNSLSSEIDLILQCASSRAKDRNRHQIELLLQSEINWSYVLEMCTRHKMLSLVYFNLNKIASPKIPENIRAILIRFYQLNLQKNLLLTSELLKVLHLFEAHKIAAIPLKGVVLAGHAYSNFGLRTIGDIDIVVQESDFSQAEELLVQYGYKPHPNNHAEDIRQAQYKKPNTLLCIDLHYAFSPKNHFISVDSVLFWDNLRTIALANQEISIFTPEYMVIYLCLEGAKEHWRTLNRICDLSELIVAHGLDWTKLLQAAKNIERQIIVYLGLYLAHTLLNMPIPDHVWQEIESALKIKPSKQDICNFLFRADFDVLLALQWHYFNLQGLKSLSHQIKYWRWVAGVNFKTRFPYSVKK